MAAGPFPVEEPLAHAIVVLPSSMDGPVGVYSGASAHLVKDLRALGVDAAYLHDPPQRQWMILMGDVPLQLLIGFGTSLMGAAAWQAVIAGLRSCLPPKHSIHAKIVRERKGKSRSVSRTWLDFEGDTDGFADALDLLRREDESEDV
jgi:hypothetical protein